MGLLEDSLKAAPIVKKGEYNYVIHPITDGVPAIGPELLKEVRDRMLDVGNFECDRIITAEAMGIPIASAISLKTGIPFAIIRKRSYGLPGEKEVKQHTGYSSSRLYINGVEKGMKLTLVDDVLSTGGTLIATVKALREMGAEIVDIIIAVEKSGPERFAEIEREIGMKVKVLARISVDGGEVRIV